MAIFSRTDLLVGAENGPSLEWPKIGQNTKTIALVFWILECVLESNEIACPPYYIKSVHTEIENDLGKI